MLCVVIAHLLLDALGIYSILHLAALAGDDDHDRYVDAFYMALGNDIGFLVISAAFSLAGAQWMLERRRVAGLPGYAAACMGVLSAVLGLAWSFVSAHLIRTLALALASTTSMQVAMTISVLIGYTVAPLLVLFSIWLPFRLWRAKEIPAVGLVDLRARGLLLFGLFAWSWVMLVLGFTIPAAAIYYASSGLDPALVHIGPYAGSMVLALPAFLGALIGLPRSMPAVRPVRIWLAALLAMLVSAIAMVAVAFVAVELMRVISGSAAQSMGMSAAVAFAWLVIATPLCWLVVKGLTRRLADVAA
ncbi:hypothetical protein [Dyella acidiphila]|uniref:DUF998 domain-containing protein n=1 Tax=Dyella acidiphila TaxID=2775866 RepID=A0ABR9GD11_9GAMM|nr:hypothetical protein [Dyella acidiphila]MBE1161935.1 hypothetical protein [Dyella acidiphila]